MAKAGSLLAKQQEQTKAVAVSPLQGMLNNASVQQRFEKMLGENAPAFLSSVLTMVNNNKALQSCHPQTILSAAAIAASMKLPVNPNLGFAWIVPYKGQGQFQMSAKGYIQLAMRSKLMECINVQTVYEGELVKGNRFTEEYEFDESKRISDKVIGYFAYFKTKFGFCKKMYWTKEAVEKHARRFSKSYNNGPWATDFDKMAEKTVLKALLSRYSPMSIELNNALEADGSVVNETGDVEGYDFIEAEAEQVEPIEPVEVPDDIEVPME